MMFNISTDTEMNIEVFEDSKIFVIDNFYANPKLVKNYILSNKPSYHKSENIITYNGIYFTDMRHDIENKEIKNVYEYLQNLCNRNALSSTILTNYFTFTESNFNNYTDNYWWPHYDCGYTAIIYLNEGEDNCGTNLYENLNKKLPKVPEHYCPWRSKSKFNLIKTFRPKFNRLIMFDALKFCHGMNICDDRYQSEYRLNQVLFFD